MHFSLPLGLLALATTTLITTRPQVHEERGNGEAQLAELLPMLAGEWEGELSYRDYQTHAVHSIGYDESCELFDEQTLLSRAAFHDPTWSLREFSVQRFDPEARTLASSMYSQRGSFQSTHALEELEVAPDGSWSAALVTEEPDNGRPAEVRILLEISAETQVRTKHVRYLDEPDARPIWRNELRLSRVAPELDAEALAGTWTVDLRPTPDAPDYEQELVLEPDASGELVATFYGTAAHDLALNTAWGELRCAFVTEDGSGPYYTNFVLEGDALIGTTHSPGRGFLARWTARRTD